jgi:hypothetical protein
MSRCTGRPLLALNGQGAIFALSPKYLKEQRFIGYLLSPLLISSLRQFHRHTP